MFEYMDLTDRFPIKFDLKKMREELELLKDKNWLSHYDEGLADGWTTIPLVSRDGSATNEHSQKVGKWGEYKETEYLGKLPYFKELLSAFKCPYGRIRIMNLLPGTEIKEHRDAYEEVSDLAFNQVRLHIPIITNEHVIFTVNNTNYHLAEGRLIYLNFSKKHYVNNNGNESRVHLVLDLKVNDWLMGIFPELSGFEKIENAIARKVIPIIWRVRSIAKKPGRLFWAWYMQSIVRKLRHKFFPK
ncbi:MULTISPECIES: aspartyl/asparaginyl beta-hydroxylase domain-containing protein [unclassified Colwellia]|uniref:aspartyl/asparaginyl beta-hydroxylase domain-containing protein n=1 Tax=unclassified Colwellia TaxID=196834 RepID=UPI0015F51F5A|nr:MULTISPECIES: aspartyl/asparaginyl beta-hydroxylase domain-containing protein [unclassified Colwellia]MBA6234367.1 aspartyl/asparaginyl beta-hydroxylase domain-containing protein [Colwellia sp. MB02u-7]MBA6237535.1 aspartyl/asparaginyl beta-hydroxylase domain-containing protein [Colwellia sp. MB02u-11]MBA6256270.1 aspartyl/asparaginyl beta-hydroxylase domain-containing protein [Colwellia sp. MB3u-28]MBA6260154.1 aspartyl/asparaginyl beta-hydroxylase domain-containing protein [Colwellia sp. M